MKSLFLCFLLSITCSAMAQSYTISGRIVDQNNAAVAFANVLLKNGPKDIATILADGDGVYMLTNIAPGNYKLVVSYLGHKSNQETVIQDKDFILNIRMELNSTELQGVSITGRKNLIERKVDRLVFNVENAVAAMGGDASDVLKLTPGVKVDQNNISMVGKGAVNILINDKVVPMSGAELLIYLKSIPADRIQKVEVISNPSAKYEAAGNSGLINIQLKSVARENSWQAIVNSAAEFATYTSLSQGMNLAYKKDKFSVAMDLTYRYGDKLYTNDIHYIYPNEELLHNDIHNKNNRKSLGALLNLQYAISDRKSIGIQYSGNLTKSQTLENTISQNFIGNLLTKNRLTHGITSAKPNVNAFNINYNEKLDSLGKKYSIDLDYFKSGSRKNNFFNADQKNLQNQTSELIYAENSGSQNIENYSLKTDFELPNSWASLSFGTKLGSTRTKYIVDAKFYNNPGNSTPYDVQYDHFEYTEHIEALYVSASKKITEKWSMQFGLRGEYAQTKSNSIATKQYRENDYFKLFPTAYLSYKINENETLDLNFGRRIWRPAFWELNPARWYMNPQSYTEGNPFLQPSFSYNLQLNYSYKSILHLGVYYNDIQEGFGQITYHDVNSETQIFKRLNYYNAKDVGGWAILNFRPLKFWEANISMSAFYKASNNYIPLFNRSFSGWGGYTRSTHIFTLNKNRTLFLNLDYNHTYAGRNRETSYTNYSSLNVGVKALFLNKKLVAGFNFEDILKNDFSTYRSLSGAVQQSFTQYYDTRLARFSLSYSFGNTKIGLPKREVGNQEERNRTN